MNWIEEVLSKCNCCCCTGTCHDDLSLILAGEEGGDRREDVNHDWDTNGCACDECWAHRHRRDPLGKYDAWGEYRWDGTAGDGPYDAGKKTCSR